MSMKAKAKRRIYNYPVISYEVIDGDSVDVTLDLGFKATLTLAIRLAGIDTPERSDPRQAKAAEVCRLAMAWVLHKMADRDGLIVQTTKPDKYGSRWGGNFHEAGFPVSTASQWMLAEGYARRYNGEAKPPWTDHELREIETKGLTGWN